MRDAYAARPWLAQYDEGTPPDLHFEVTDMLAVFRLSAAESPERVAVRYFDSALTYADLDRLSDALAVHLLDNGFQRGDRIAVQLQNMPQFAIAVLAGWKAGGILVPVNPMYTERELTTILTDSGATAVVGLERLWDKVIAPSVAAAGVGIAISTSELDLQTRNDPRVLSVVPRTKVADLLEITARNEGRTPPPVEYAAGDIALLTYTSGTSGIPKGATNTHGNVSFNAQGFRDLVGLPRGSRIFGLAPLFHITGLVSELAGSLALGGELVLVHRFEAGAVLDALLETRPHFMVGPSTAYIALMNHPEVTPDHFSSLELAYSGGAPLPGAVVDAFEQRFGPYIHNSYGLTETTAPATSTPRHQRAPLDESSGSLSVGLPVPNAVVRIVDDEGNPLPLGETGEIVISGPMVVPAYWGRPEATAESIREGRLFTGDVGFMDEQGWVYIVDRKKDMISASGFKVWPREVEDVLYGHPAVREVAVVGVPDSYRGETVKAYVSLRPQASASPEELIEFAKQRMAAFKYPRSVELLEELPKTATGKILRRELRARG
ncbi:AMP-binding protein [Kutzneria albida]|uniref:Long-chain-fatty-acid--CoA ligase n=1 Tax=Kutzneria albida DSM 43870 TaxID=1449976 RepID=W5W552_9PSEU|nr:AMP-binding protein [Kutzneria albida]AHH95591.1 long-chain-fatty-acid--CoA ligase [Kutzneria albida DSM 43870]